MLFEVLKAVTLGVVEGITEFLPISSTGHLILVNQFLSFNPDFTVLFDIVIQLGAILSVVVVFWKRLWPFGADLEYQKTTLNLWYKTLVGVLPALALGALLGDFIEEKLFNPWVVAAALIVGGVILIAIEKKSRLPRINTIAQLSFKTAFFIGLIQTLAMIPGTSRAAATIIGAMLLGVSRLLAVEFSFFLAIPTMVAASGYSLLKAGFALTASELILLAIGFIVSFTVALTVIKFFLNFVRKNNFVPFGYYRIILGILVLAIFLLKIAI